MLSNPSRRVLSSSGKSKSSKIRSEAEGVILVFNRDWDGPISVASIHSRPQYETCLTAVGCRFEHVVA
jgi:hypothetical protein